MDEWLTLPPYMFAPWSQEPAQTMAMVWQTMLQKLVENEVREQIREQVEALNRRIDEVLNQESLAAKRIADVLNALFCSNGVDTDDVTTFRQDLMMMKDRQTNLDGEIETLEYDFEEMRQDGNGEQWHALKESNEEQ